MNNNNSKIIEEKANEKVAKFLIDSYNNGEMIHEEGDGDDFKVVEIGNNYCITETIKGERKKLLNSFFSSILIN